MWYGDNDNINDLPIVPIASIQNGDYLRIQSKTYGQARLALTDIPFARSMIWQKLQRCAAAAKDNNLIVNAVDATKATITNPGSAPSTTGMTNLIPGTTGFVVTFTGDTVFDSEVIRNVSSVAGLIVGQGVVESTATSVYAASIPYGAEIVSFDSVALTVTMNKKAIGSVAGGTIRISSNLFHCIGGVPASYANFMGVRGSSTTGGNNVFQGHAYEFWTNAADASIAAPTIIFDTSANAASPNSFRVAIDDHYCTANPVAFAGTGTGQTWITIEFAAAGRHKVRVELAGLNLLRGLWITTGYTAWREDPSNIARICWFGDSYYSVGGTNTWPMRGMSQVASHLLGVQGDLVGTANSGLADSGGFSSSKRMVDTTQRNYDMIVNMASVNDYGDTAATLTANCLLQLQRQRAFNPNAPIVYMDVWTRQQANLAQALVVSNAVKAGYDLFDDANKYWVPICQDPRGDWLNAVSELVYVDGGGIHLAETVGTLYAGMRQAEEISKIIQRAA